MHHRTVAVLDLSSGTIRDCASYTPTLDVPADFDRRACIATVDTRARAHYRSVSGSTLLNLSHPRPLSWRVRGEECLVAGPREADQISYRLCAVDPAPLLAPRARPLKT